jgi:RNA polymerase sigma factor (sigma-70 family)
MFQYGIRFKNDPEFIKDCIQDVFFKLIQAGEKLSPTENIRFYLFRALKNAIYKEMDKSKKIELVEFVTLKFDAPFALEEEIAEKENASNKEIALLKALNGLSHRQREIIYLRYESGMEYDQICDIMQLKNDSARKLVFRAIKSLKEIIDDKLRLPILLLIRFSNKDVL